MAIALVGSQIIKATAFSTSITLTLPANPTAQNFIPVGVVTSGTLSGVASTNDTYTSALSETGTYTAAGYYAANIVGGAGSKAIVVSGTSSIISGWAWEFSGVLKSSPLDKSGGSASSLTPGSLTPTQANELWITVASNQSNALTAPAGYTDGINQAGGAVNGDTAYLIESGSGAQNPSWTATSSGPASLLLSFKSGAPIVLPVQIPKINRQAVNRSNTF